MTYRQIRLFLNQPLTYGQQLVLDQSQAHYLFSVMRAQMGHAIDVFNGQDGVWTAEIISASKRAGLLRAIAQKTPQVVPPDLWLLFAPIKKARTDFIVEKATEMGVRSIQPVQTQHTNTDRINKDRLQAHAIEATEQCGGCFVPDVKDLMKLETLLAAWPKNRQLVFCDEQKIEHTAPTGAELFSPGAVLIGPEGGFAPEERDQISRLPQSYAISLGPRVLRADTAAVAALTFWQLYAGDWR